MKGHCRLNFIKESYDLEETEKGKEESNKRDQPSLLQWLASPFKAKNFSAVLGSPVDHSHSPTEQRAFSESLGQGFYAIPIHRDEKEKSLYLF